MQLVPRRVAATKEVELDAGNQLQQFALRDLVASHGLCQDLHDRVAEFAAHAACDAVAVVIQPFRQVAAVRSVGVVVHLPREAVERVDRNPLLVRQRDETPVEVLGLATREIGAKAFGGTQVELGGAGDRGVHVGQAGSARRACRSPRMVCAVARATRRVCARFDDLRPARVRWR